MVVSEFENAKRRSRYQTDPEYREKAKKQSIDYKDTNREKIRRYYRQYDQQRKEKVQP
jgi:hypothetical protein